MIKHEELFIGGKWVRSGGVPTPVVSPASEEVIGQVTMASTADIDVAVAAGREAFDRGPWPHMPVDSRREILRQAGHRMAEIADELSVLITSENGSPIRIAPGNAAGHFAYYTSLDLPAEEYRVGPGGEAALIVHEPVGVLAAIMPWNTPLALSLHTILPALLAGCSVVLKPAPETPLHSYRLAQAFADAGLPPGVLNVTPCDREVAEALVRHPGVDMISFVGSTATGARIGAICGEQVKRVRLELGGKSAAILLDDVDAVSTAAAVLSGGMLLNNGQTCASLTRLLVPNSRYSEMVDAMCDFASQATIGDPLDSSTVLGPLVSQRQRERVEGYIGIGVAEGAKIVLGGGRPTRLTAGYYVEPTIFTHVHNSMRIAREEIFGPVVAVIGYESDSDAVATANDSEYGLAGAVYTADNERGIAIARQIRTGTMGVNCPGYGLAFPFGGYKRSGIGREHGPESISDVMEIKTIGLPSNHDARAYTAASGTA
ncbi:MAG TPA: aldehyde dehydrogenase [Jatrophihabitantaceae bacterium]|nr:aldehyde dehydrogenase [Jatrophihabitantaceae bacterium]